jgi:hypothetical protein
MFTTLFNKTAKLTRNKLNGAIVLSVAAMLSFNVLVLATQAEQAATIAQASADAARQA